MAIFDHFQGSYYGKMAILMFYLEAISALAFAQIWNCECITTVGVNEALSF